MVVFFFQLSSFQSSDVSSFSAPESNVDTYPFNDMNSFITLCGSSHMFSQGEKNQFEDHFNSGNDSDSLQPVSHLSLLTSSEPLSLLISRSRRSQREKKFACPSCEYRTADRSHLKRHIRIHTGEKPFACDYCDYRSSDQSTLKRHLRIH